MSSGNIPRENALRDGQNIVQGNDLPVPGVGNPDGNPAPDANTGGKVPVPILNPRDRAPHPQGPNPPPAISQAEMFVLFDEVNNLLNVSQVSIFFSKIARLEATQRMDKELYAQIQKMVENRLSSAGFEPSHGVTNAAKSANDSKATKSTKVTALRELYIGNKDYISLSPDFMKLVKECLENSNTQVSSAMKRIGENNSTDKLAVAALSSETKFALSTNASSTERVGQQYMWYTARRMLAVALGHQLFTNKANGQSSLSFEEWTRNLRDELDDEKVQSQLLVESLAETFENRRKINKKMHGESVTHVTQKVAVNPYQRNGNAPWQNKNRRGGASFQPKYPNNNGGNR